VKPIDKQTHEGDCLNVVVPCPANVVMCPWTGPRSSLDGHVAQCSFNHLQPVLSSLLRQLKEQADQSTSLRQELKEQKDLHLKQSTSYQRQLQGLEGQSTFLRQELDVLKQQLPKKCRHCQQWYLPAEGAMCKAHGEKISVTPLSWKCKDCGVTNRYCLVMDCNRRPHSQ